VRSSCSRVCYMLYFNKALTRASIQHIRPSVNIRNYRGSLVVRFQPAPLPEVAESAKKAPVALWTKGQLAQLKEYFKQTTIAPKAKKLPWYLKLLWWYIAATTIGALILLDYNVNYKQYVQTGDEHLFDAIKGWFIQELAQSYVLTNPRLFAMLSPSGWDKGKWKFRKVVITTEGNPISKIIVTFLAFNTLQGRLPFYMTFSFSATKIPCYETTQTLGPEFQEYILTLNEMKHFVGLWNTYNHNEIPELPIQFKSRYYAEQFTFLTVTSWRRYLYFWPWSVSSLLG